MAKIQQVPPQPQIGDITVSQQVVKAKLNFPMFTAKDGEYHLIKLDKNGNEIPGSDVSVSPRTYERTFKNLKNYKVKKNPNQ